MWYEQVNLNEYYHHVNFRIYHIYGNDVWENPNVSFWRAQTFDQPRKL